MGENSRVIQYHVDDRREVRKSNLHHRFYSMAEKSRKIQNRKGGSRKNQQNAQESRRIGKKLIEKVKRRLH